MKTVALVRYETGDAGTFGRVFSGSWECHSLELPWRNNQRNISCIPSGRYEVVPHNSPRFGRCYLLLGVPNRSEILIHRGNWAGDKAKGLRSDVEGCILFGDSRSIGKPEGFELQAMVTNSGKTCERFRDHMNAQPFTLEIIEAV